MKLIERLVDGFILTVGITPPTPRMRRVATAFIALGISISLLAVLAFFVFLLTRLPTTKSPNRANPTARLNMKERRGG